MTRPRDLYRRGDGDMSLSNRANTGTCAQAVFERDAESGSTALANRCLRAFDHFAEEHGIGPDEARILLLDTGIAL